MLKFGIYLGYAPEQPIKNQGIGRLMTFIVAAALKKYSTITIACPSWYEGLLFETLQENGIDVDKIHILTTKKLPLIIRIRNFFLKKSEGSGFFRKISNIFFSKIRKLNKICYLFLLGFFASRTFLSFTIKLPLIIPILLIGGTAYVLQKILFFVKQYFTLVSQKISFYDNFFSTSVIKRNIFLSEIYKTLRKKEFDLLNKIINKNSNITAWYVPSLFWPEIKHINSKKLVAAPDLVYLDFPNFYSTDFFNLLDEKIRKTIVCADKFVCYSDYVKKNHLIDGVEIPSSSIEIVPHGWVDLSKYLMFDNKCSRLKAKTLLREWYENYFSFNSWFKDFNITNVDYFFYSSQDRPHKNLLNLVKAYEHLLRKKYVNVKLVLTARIITPEVVDYIQEHKLNYDIVELYDVPTNVLAALNMLAVCAINPSYFEGGFPFTFSEAYSVGTPSIMSDIPVVREVVTDPTLIQSMLFDPTDYLAMAEKMAWAYSHREELFILQKDLASKLQERTWEVVAEEYFQLMESL